MSGFPPETDDLTPEETDRALAGEYVLGLLDGAELRAFEARLAAEPALRDLVARWSEDFAAAFEEVPAVPPPRGAEEALMRRLFPESRARQGFAWRLLPWVLGAAVVAGAAFMALNPEILGRGGEPELLARIASDTQDLVVEASWDADTRQLELRRTAGEVPEGRDLELWLVRVDEGTTVSLGVIPREPEGVIEVSAELAPEFPQNALALSDEPLGGSPTGQATGPVVAIGPLAEP